MYQTYKKANHIEAPDVLPWNEQAGCSLCAGRPFPPCGPAVSSQSAMGPETSGNPSLLDSRHPLANTQETEFGSRLSGGQSKEGSKTHMRPQTIHQLNPSPLAQEGTVLTAVEGGWQLSALMFREGFLTAAEQ